MSSKIVEDPTMNFRGRWHTYHRRGQTLTILPIGAPFCSMLRTTSCDGSECRYVNTTRSRERFMGPPKSPKYGVGSVKSVSLAPAWPSRHLDMLEVAILPLVPNAARRIIIFLGSKSCLVLIPSLCVACCLKSYSFPVLSAYLSRVVEVSARSTMFRRHRVVPGAAMLFRRAAYIRPSQLAISSTMVVGGSFNNPKIEYLYTLVIFCQSNH
jgi:hypothetical protein